MAGRVLKSTQYFGIRSLEVFVNEGWEDRVGGEIISDVCRQTLPADLKVINPTTTHSQHPRAFLWDSPTPEMPCRLEGQQFPGNVTLCWNVQGWCISRAPSWSMTPNWLSTDLVIYHLFWGCSGFFVIIFFTFNCFEEHFPVEQKSLWKPTGALRAKICFRKFYTSHGKPR